MNFICIDSNCKKKGLICSVCQNSSHSGHQALHLKIFLSEIHKNLMKSNSTNDEKDLLSLGEQLRRIEASKKEMEKVLKAMVMQIT